MAADAIIDKLAAVESAGQCLPAAATRLNNFPERHQWPDCSAYSFHVRERRPPVARTTHPRCEHFRMLVMRRAHRISRGLHAGPAAGDHEKVAVARQSG